MKRHHITFIVGILIGALLFGGAAAIAAAITATPTQSSIFVDGEPVSVDAYLINGNNYFKLRDFCAALDTGVWYEQVTKNIYIESENTYDPDYTGPISVKVVSISGERGAGIPAVFTAPVGDGPYPAVILCHGHGGSKDEAGGFATLSNALAIAGIASIRMDFPGCGESEEDFVTQNNMTNMLSDVGGAKAFLAEQDNIDMSRLGIVGYSMGGRIAMLTADDSYKAVALWAPAGTPGASDMFAFMQCEDQDAFDALYDTAKEEGKVTYTAIFGFDQTLGVQWFDDMLGFDPTAAFAGYKGDLLTIYGDLDIIIPQSAAVAAAEAGVAVNSSDFLEVEGADHGYGMYSGEPGITQQVVNRIVGFLSECL